MESTQRLIGTWMASGSVNAIANIASDIASDRTSILNVVKALGEYLTSADGTYRTKGVDLLSSVLAQCPSEKLNRQSTRVLVTYYCEKLDDTDTIIPALRGILVLAPLPSCLSNDATTILRAMFSHVKMIALEQSSRFLVFSIIDALMSRHRETLKDMGPEFLTGYINLVENEKDPRNLLIAFAIDRVILIEFDISHHVEALFNITFCYFPITFRPPPEDTSGITAESLKTALGACLNATPAFGPPAIPFYLEKLVAGSPITKTDTLRVMSSCFPVYGTALARSSATKLWSAIKLEIFHPADSATEEAALSAVKELIKIIYLDEQPDVNESNGLLCDVCDECVQALQEPEKSQAKPAIKVLCALLSTTPSVSRYVISRAATCLVELFTNSGQFVNRPWILMLLSDVIIAARDSGQTEPTIAPFKGQILSIEFEGLKSPACRQPLLNGLKVMATTKSLLTDEELGVIVQNVNDILEAAFGDDDFSDESLDLLSTVSSSAPWHIQEKVLPLLFSMLPFQAPRRTETVERTKCQRILSVLSELCTQPELFEILVIRLLAKLESLRVIPDEATIEANAAYAYSLLTTLFNTLTTKLHKRHTDVSNYSNRLVPRIYALYIGPTLLSDGHFTLGADPRLVGKAAQVVSLVIRTLPLVEQGKFASALFSAYMTGDTKKIVEGYVEIPTDATFSPFSPSASTVQKNLVALFSAGIIAFHGELRIPVPNLNEFLDMLMNWQTDNALQRDAAWQIVGSIVNKRPDDVTTFLSSQLTSPPEGRRSWAWISKALLLSGHASLFSFVDRLFGSFGDPDVNWVAARVVGEMCVHDDIFSKANHAVIKILYAQKYVNAVLPRLSEGANAGDRMYQQSCLVALALLVKSVPKATFSHLMSSVVPLLIRGLALPDEEVQTSIIHALTNITEGNIIAEHASTLVSKMLKNSMVHEMPSVRVRIASLRYLGYLPDIVRYEVLHPHKSLVIRELGKVLDDPKRSVRKEAVQARTIWTKMNRRES